MTIADVGVIVWGLTKLDRFDVGLDLRSIHGFIMCSYREHAVYIPIILL